MKTFVALGVILLGIHSAAAVTHSLHYFYTGSSGVPGFPEFVTVGMVDGQPFSYYDSVIKREIPKQDWMAKNEGPEYWERQTQASIGAEPVFKNNIEVAKKRFNQTGGAHIVQMMYGCEWDDQTDKVVDGFMQYGYDGEDFIVFDLKTETWTAPKQEAFFTKNKWDNDKADIAQWNNYLTQICPDWLKKYMNYGKSSLMRTELPSVSLLQKTPSSPVSCHATGFYPDRADLFWRKDGEELHEGRREILPNHDGSFQMRADLKLSSVKPEDWGKYECVFQLSGVKDVVTKLDKAVIRSNEKTDMTIIIVVAVVVVALVVIAVVGFMVYKKKKDGEAKVLNNSPDNGSDVTEELNPKA